MEISDEAGRSIAYTVFDAKIDPSKNLYICFNGGSDVFMMKNEN